MRARSSVTVGAAAVLWALSACRAPVADTGAGGGGGSADGAGGSGGGAPALPPSKACVRYLACVAADAPDDVAQATDAFGDGAACWTLGASAAASCDATCRAQAQGLAGCGECSSDADCAGQGAARTCIAGSCASPACALDASALTAMRAPACACDPVDCDADLAFVAELVAAAVSAACGPQASAWARCEASALDCRDGHVDLYGACDEAFDALTRCENRGASAVCPPVGSEGSATKRR
jgi:hypothetical protein